MKTPLFKSRRFWIAVMDAFFSILGIVLTAYLNPDQLKLALSVVGYLQPVVIALIAAFTVDDTVATLRAAG